MCATTTTELPDLSRFGEKDCYSCHGTGRIIGWGNTGRECGCLVRCEECDELIADAPVDIDDDGRQARVTCDRCVAEAAAEAVR